MQPRYNVPEKIFDPAEWIEAARSDLDEATELVASSRAALADAVRFAREEFRWTWAEVGLALGISRQAAQERFGRYEHVDQAEQ